MLAAARARLENAEFTSKAPPAVVEGAIARAAELSDQVARLEARLAD
jgi:valyl-tRNA synthetase